MNECTICGHSEQLHYVPDDSPYPKLACIWGDSEGPCLCPGFKREALGGAYDELADA